MQIDLVKKRYFITLLIFLVIAVSGVVYDTTNRTIEEYLVKKTDQMDLEYNVIYNHNKTIADLIFKTLVNDPQIIGLFRDRERKRLHQRLLTDYEELKYFSIRQLHFHLPNNDSFLRMHRPSKFGDNLSKARLTVKYVNEHKKYIDGFEEGKIFNGFRFVYPLFDAQKHIGSVEISFSALAFIQAVVKSYKIKSNFIINKDIVAQKVFDDEQSNYVQSPLPQYYFQRSIIEYLKVDYSKRPVLKYLSDDIHARILTGDSFSSYDRHRDEVVTFIPLKNPITGDAIAAITFRSPDISIAQEQKSSLVILLTSILIIAVVLLLIYKELRYKMDLEHKIIDRTKELLVLNERLEGMANVDPLTGAYNRRYLYTVSEKIIPLIKRERRRLSLAMIDIDRFKDINDTYGHDRGDEVLKILVEKVTDSIRESDVFIRYGGEEFVLLFPNTTLQQALVISEKVRKVIDSSPGVHDVRFTVSVGVTEFINGSDNIDSALKRADIALYKAKNSGRNRVEYIEEMGTRG